MSDIVTLTPIMPFQETIHPEAAASAKDSQRPSANSDLAQLEQCATQLARDVVGSDAALTINKETSGYHFTLQASAGDTSHLEGANIGNLWAKAKSLLRIGNASSFNFAVADNPEKSIAMSVMDQRGNPDNPESFRRAAAYVSLNGQNVQIPGSIQTGKIGELDLGQLSSTDSLGVQAVKSLRDCMR